MDTSDGAQDRTPTQQPIINITIILDGQIFNRDAEKPGNSPASKASIEAMATVEVTEAGKDCTICLEELAIGAAAREMPCKHVFHSPCIEKWLNMHASCPVCRYLMPLEEEIAGGDESEADYREQLRFFAMLMRAVAGEGGD